VVTANGDDLTDTSDPSRVIMRQIVGSFHEYEKARLVAKLKAARDAKKALTGKCGGRKSYVESNPELVAAKALRATPHVAAQARSRAGRTRLRHPARPPLFGKRRPIDAGRVKGVDVAKQAKPGDSARKVRTARRGTFF
jgi:hypothetical protein